MLWSYLSNMIIILISNKSICDKYIFAGVSLILSASYIDNNRCIQNLKEISYTYDHNMLTTTIIFKMTTWLPQLTSASRSPSSPLSGQGSRLNGPASTLVLWGTSVRISGAAFVSQRGGLLLAYWHYMYWCLSSLHGHTAVILNILFSYWINSYYCELGAPRSWNHS